MIDSRWIAVLLSVVLLAPMPLRAQDVPAAAAPPLSLGQAYEIAAENNPAYRRVRGELRTAAAAERQGWGAFLPSLSLELTTGATLARTYTGRDDFGETVTLEDPREYTNSSASQRIALGGLTLFDGGARLAEWRAARSGARAARLAVTAEVNRLEAEITRRYFDALRTERLIELEERLLETAREQLEANRRLLGVAAATPVDVLGAEIDVARQEQEIAKARGEAIKAMIGLREEIGLPGDSAWTLADELPAGQDVEILDVDSMAVGVLGANPRVQRLEAQVEAAGQRLRAARADRFPVVSASASAGRSAYRSEYGALGEFNPLDQSVGFGLSISIPVFSQFRTSYTIQQARVQLEVAREELRAERLLAERELRVAILDLQNAVAAASLAERAAELSRDRVELAREQFRLGGITFTELQTIVDRAAQAERDALNARFQVVEAQITLREKSAAPTDAIPDS